MVAPLIILAIAFAVQLAIPKARLKNIGLFGIIVFLMAAAVIFGMATYQSWQQYLIWKSSDFGKLLLPPYQDWDYFVFYARSRFFNPYFLSLAVGIIFLAAAKYSNKQYQERFFENLEPYLFAEAIFSVGHPLWLFYLMILLTIFLIINFSLFTFHFLMNKEIPRISLYYLWLPGAIFTILISKWLSVLPWWQILKI